MNAAHSQRGFVQPILSTGARCQYAPLITSHLLRQSFHNQLVRVIDHSPQLNSRDATLDLDSIPVFLVHVITGPDLFVSIAEVER
jgi:hypothetical protein